MGLRILSNTGRACCRLPFRGELLLTIIRLHSIISELCDAIATANGVSIKLKARAGSLFSQAFSRRTCLVSRLVLLSVLGFAAARCLREHPQCVSGFSAASMLKFVDPIGHGLNHITRRFTSGICLCLNDGAGFFALLYDSNCFLLRHCYLSSSYECLLCIQRISRHSVP